MLGDLTKEEAFTAVLETAAFFGTRQPQTREFFKETEHFIKLGLCLPVSVAGSE